VGWVVTHFARLRSASARRSESLPNGGSLVLVAGCRRTRGGIDVVRAGAPIETERPPERAATDASRLWATVAALVYLGLAIWFLRPVLADPTRLLAFPVRVDGREESAIGVLDQAMVVAVAVRNARVLTSRPWDLIGGQLCHPMPDAHTLGEHMFGLGVLAAPGYALTGDPLASYNTALVLTLWIPALAMYAFAWSFTGSPPAALVAGLLFGFLPVRIADLAHPFTHGDLWAPLVLLFWWRLMARGRWRDAFGFAAFVSLQTLESLYSVLECAALLLPFGLWASWRHRTQLRSRAGKVAVAAAIILGVAWLVFGPYLATRATWALLSARGGWLANPRGFWLGGLYYPGSVAFALALVALADRCFRGPRPSRDGGDPRWAVAAGGLLAMWLALAPVRIPGLEAKLPAPLLLARGIVPGLDAIRVPALVGYGFTLACAFLASFGIVALARRPRGRAALAVGALAAVVALAERIHEPLAAMTFARTTDLTVTEVRPDERAIALVRSLDGPIVDLPSPVRRKLGVLRALSEQMLLAAYHGQPTSSCYNSFGAPVTEQVWALADRLPDPRAAEALATMGFTSVVALDRFLPRGRKEALDAAASRAGPGTTGLRTSQSAAGLSAYSLSTAGPALSGWRLLGPSQDPGAPSAVAAGESVELPFAIENTSEVTFRHPSPIAPSTALVRWWRAEGARDLAGETEARLLLPLALAPGDAHVVAARTVAPAEPGEYEVTLVLPAELQRALARTRVRVHPRSG
jgi:hypothetical protein